MGVIWEPILSDMVRILACPREKHKIDGTHTIKAPPDGAIV